MININNIVFTCITLAFALDSIINHYLSVPLFALTLPVFSVILMAHKKTQKKPVLLILSLALITIASIKAIFGTIQIEDAADLFYLIFCVISFNHFIKNPPSSKTFTISGYILLSLFLPTFIGINSTEHEFGNSSEVVEYSSNLEFYRDYRTGFFRLAHLAAYVLFLFSIFTAIEYRKNKTTSKLILLFIFSCATIAAGSRTPIAAFAASLLIYYTTRSIKTIPVGALITLVGFLLLQNIKSLLALATGTPFFQYISFVQTTLNDPTSLSRIMIWQSWLHAIQEFNYLDFLVGRSLSESMAWNSQHLGVRIWFHNDYLGTYYAYGIIGLLFYLSIIQDALSLKNKRENIFIFSIVFFIFFAGLTNGFFKYAPYLFAAALGLLSSSSRKQNQTAKPSPLTRQYSS